MNHSNFYKWHIIIIIIFIEKESDTEINWRIFWLFQTSTCFYRMITITNPNQGLNKNSVPKNDRPQNWSHCNFFSLHPNLTNLHPVKSCFAVNYHTHYIFESLQWAIYQIFCQLVQWKKKKKLQGKMEYWISRLFEQNKWRTVSPRTECGFGCSKFLSYSEINESTYLNVRVG